MEAALTLEQWLGAELYRLLLVFCRVSTAFMLLPGLGEAQVSVRVRVPAGLLVAYCIAPLAGPAPAMPGIWAAAAAVALEVASGAFLGTLSRLLLSAVQVAGQIIGQSIGISNAFVFGVGPDSSAVLGATLYAACLVALFAVDGHHLGLRALADSYALVPLGMPLPSAAAARSASEGMAAAFRLAMQLSMPFLILSVLFNVALAGINRALPAMPVFMIGAPALLMVGLHLLEVTAPSLVSEIIAAYGAAIALRP
ncbi:flagellar biosynthesis protein [Pseudoroseomonas rhizosphaerae]|uniref:Flagellar biosynthesis protein n=1 Tax=Teichococcus rhizosphaerae TaxID=1335062 RepID=A0A2C6XYW7_9PROT|nr:flagellar biosynthetic protein FliR [Pseudoroseomonas rhizosphaerae]PHK93722.1 flagellar biosynthesis protein [Pseudoroseomonas rhizosphaerae]